MVYQADWLLTPGEPPRHQGWVQILGDTIQAIGSGADAPEAPFRMSGCVLAPGLVNAHCHLELTGLENMLSPVPFPQWVEALQKASQPFQPLDYRSAAKLGIARLLEGGTTSVLDVGNSGEALAALAESPLRAQGFVEVLGLDPKTASDRFARALKIANALPTTSDRFQTGLSIHAVYSCSQELATFIVWHQKARHLPVTLHVSESREEFELFADGTGTLQDFCRRIFPEAPRYRDKSPVQILEKWDAFSKQTLVVHGNHLSETDISTLSRHQASVVHCPSSHAFFGHAAFPYAKLRQQGIRVCLGTDSMASGNSLSMLEQMKLFQNNFPGVSAAEILGLATEMGAAALGLKKVGKLETGGKADFIAVNTDPIRNGNPFDSLLSSASKVVFSMIDGKEVFSRR